MSLIRALGIVKCQLALVLLALRSNTLLALRSPGRVAEPLVSYQIIDNSLGGIFLH